MDDTRPISQDVHSSMWFLAQNESYLTIKPYTLAFTPEIDIPRENIHREEKSISISDIRGSHDDLNFDRNGFMVLNFRKQHNDVNWNDEETLKKTYYPEVASEVEKAFPGAHCIALHHQIRRRHSSFPNSTGKDYTYGQPLLAAHVDLVRSSAEQLIQERLGEQAGSVLVGKYMIANVWRLLKGPNDDYPLALCDLTTVDPKQDLEIADYITPKTNREHCLLYARDAHRWWYLSRQETSEALVFLQYHSERGVSSGVPHASFLNPNSLQKQPRESIEVPVLIWYNKDSLDH